MTEKQVNKAGTSKAKEKVATDLTEKQLNKRADTSKAMTSKA